MKPEKSTTKKVIAAVFFAVFISACGCVRAQVITMTVKTKPEQKVGFIIAGAIPANIDWGDEETGNDQDEETTMIVGRLKKALFGVEHKYLTASTHTVTITGDNIMDFRCSGHVLTGLDVSKNTVLTVLYCTHDSLTNLDVSKNTALTWLLCDNNQIEHLDVSKNTALTRLDCGNNNFSASALNALFETLHSNDLEDEKIIKIYGNPGTDTCNRKIAEDKKWKVVVTDEIINTLKP
jgi:hypothetical protein